MGDVIASDARVGIRDSIQQTIVGSIISLVEVDCTEFGGTVLRFHNHAMKPTKVGEDEWEATKVVYNGNEYTPHPYGLSGVSYDSAQAPNPTLVVGNADNVVSALCLEYQDLLDAKVTIITTLADYLDNGVNPNTEENLKSVWYISSKKGEDDEQVAFKLSSPADVEGTALPSRVITTHCSWALRGWYRSGRGCGYMGVDMYDVDDNPTQDPSKDVCGGFFNSCKIRFKEAPMDFGGFPASSLIGG